MHELVNIGTMNVYAVILSNTYTYVAKRNPDGVMLTFSRKRV